MAKWLCAFVLVAALGGSARAAEGPVPTQQILDDYQAALGRCNGVKACEEEAYAAAIARCAGSDECREKVPQPSGPPAPPPPPTSVPVQGGSTRSGAERPTDERHPIDPRAPR